MKAQLQRSGITLLEGNASFSAPNRLTIAGAAGSETIVADKFLITVGVHPAPSKQFLADGEHVLSLDQLLSGKMIPQHLIMAGAGLTGIEYASMMAHLGAKVTITDPRSTVLNFVDDEIVSAFTAQLVNIGVEFRLGVTVTNCKVEGQSVTVTLSDGKQLVADALIDVTGYHGNTASLGLDKAGVPVGEDGKLEVNERFQTRTANIYAAGDVIGFPIEGLYYGSISMEQARLAVCNMFSRPAASNPECYPYAIYAMPEIAMVGQTEQSLKREGIDYQVGVARYEELVKAQIAGESGFLKLLFDPDTLHLLGVHVMGAGAAEVIHVGQAVLRYGGTIEYLRENVFNYPTIAEAYQLAAVDGLRKVGWLPAARSTAAG
ncbi:MAG: FAD-dependent oxidoreductase [Acidobacteriales bacterium]|nr:FAD-dependent oxidoreductase [Terriglobales bacterium]